MFRKMRRNTQALTYEESINILKRGSYGILACLGDDGYPYAVPLNYVYSENHLYMHCAKSGHKIDAILNNPKVCFTVVDKDTIVSEQYTTHFRSVIAFGKASTVEGERHKTALRLLIEKFCSERDEQEKNDTVLQDSHALTIAIDIEHLSGKQAKELVP
ncbi:MAG: pyridoxamine 5'-phosphate oxidase family protein [Spirochaetia bacterium]|nr:pyridoxamine 5'-phosphate oxidase family protein [Spirochaetia bacterium]